MSASELKCRLLKLSLLADDNINRKLEVKMNKEIHQTYKNLFIQMPLLEVKNKIHGTSFDE